MAGAGRETPHTAANDTNGRQVSNGSRKGGLQQAERVQIVGVRLPGKHQFPMNESRSASIDQGRDPAIDLARLDVVPDPRSRSIDPKTRITHSTIEQGYYAST